MICFLAFIFAITSLQVSSMSHEAVVWDTSTDKEALLHFLVEVCHANVNAVESHNGESAMMYTCSNYGCNHLDASVIECLIDLGADVIIVDYDGLSALDHATMILSTRDDYYTFNDREAINAEEKENALLEVGAIYGPPNSKYKNKQLEEEELSEVTDNNKHQAKEPRHLW